jgi:hypothetical protein
MAYTVNSSPLAKLGAKTMVNLMFPLEDQPTYHTHHIIFTVYETKREARNAPDKTTPIATIKLPMTQELQVSYNAGYANPDLGGVMAAAISAVEKMATPASELGGNTSIEKAMEIASNVSKTIGSTAKQIPAIAGNVLLGALGDPAKVAVATAVGIARNPHKATLFEGTDFRSHSFSFRFSPVRASESDAIKNIIHLFKYHMHPGYVTGTLAGAGNHFFTTPEFFKIQLSNEGKYTVSDYQTCVLKGMSVNYQPSNYPAYARVNGSAPAPMEVIMNLEFQETAIITKEVIGDPYSSTDEIKANKRTTDQMKANIRGASD